MIARAGAKCFYTNRRPARKCSNKVGVRFCPSPCKHKVEPQYAIPVTDCAALLDWSKLYRTGRKIKLADFHWVKGGMNTFSENRNDFVGRLLHEGGVGRRTYFAFSQYQKCLYGCQMPVCQPFLCQMPVCQMPVRVRCCKTPLCVRVRCLCVRCPCVNCSCVRCPCVRSRG